MFGFKTPVPYPFGVERTGYLVTDMDEAVRRERKCDGKKPGTDYGIFYAGSFLKETQPGRNLNCWALWAGYKFHLRRFRRTTVVVDAVSFPSLGRVLTAGAGA